MLFQSDNCTIVQKAINICISGKHALSATLPSAIISDGKLEKIQVRKYMPSNYSF